MQEFVGAFESTKPCCFSFHVSSNLEIFFQILYAALSSERREEFLMQSKDGSFIVGDARNQVSDIKRYYFFVAASS